MEQLIAEIDETLFSIAKTYDQILDIYFDDISDYQKVKDLIANASGEAQRSAEWYEKRNTCVTASDIASILGDNKYKSAKQVLVEKCGERKFFGNSFTEWGNKYEPIATALYEFIYKVRVYEANLLIHKVFKYIGASCDGFVIDENNKDGHLIEIKCPVNREIIHGTVPKHYLAQPLTQMEVTKVSKCAFFECKFEEYQSEADFIADAQAPWPHRGIFLEILTPGESKPQYIYPPIALSYEATYELLANEALKYPLSSHRFIWYRLKSFARTFIPRDRNWFKENIDYLRYFWKQVEYYRATGYENIRKIILTKK